MIRTHPEVLATPRLRLALAGVLLFAVLGTLALLLVRPAMAQEAALPQAIDPAVLSYAFMAAALATAASAIGAGIAVARVGTAAVGALAEKPELFGRLLIFIGLAEGIAIYGLIVSILILNRIGG
ncbi:MAG: H+transporting two-sector ATPase C subunit [Rhodanobacteraceae bacterium]|nr:H+transporting two-sector ATPase C subunit [Rhodanobacteraceae bacterium]